MPKARFSTRSRRRTRRGKALLLAAAERFRLTARGYHRVLRLARTIADLEGVETVSTPHIAEALGYRLIGTPEL
jgi:magnesium chelatase family protein